MLTWLAKLVPNQWKWSVAIKKISYTVAKLAVSGVVYLTAGKEVDLKGFEETMAMVVGGGLELLHDYLRMRFPESRWL